MRGWSDEAALSNPRIREAYNRALGTGPQMAAALLAASGMEKPKPTKARRMDGFDSKLEASRYEYHKQRKAAGLICDVLRQPRFDLPGGVRYSADFAVYGVEEMGGGHGVTFEEIKGSKMAKNARDSRTRFRVASGLYRWASFVWVEWRDGAWYEERVS